jgi:hypothetical protein
MVFSLRWQVENFIFSTSSRRPQIKRYSVPVLGFKKMVLLYKVYLCASYHLYRPLFPKKWDNHVVVVYVIGDSTTPWRWARYWLETCRSCLLNTLILINVYELVSNNLCLRQCRVRICNIKNPQNTSFTGEQACGSILPITNALRGGISPTCLGYPWRCSCHLCAYHRGTLGKWLATRNWVYLKVAVSPFFAKQGRYVL